MAAAMAFGLAYELWAKMPLESGHQSAAAGASAAPSGPADERAAAAGITDEQRTEIAELVPALATLREVPVAQAHEAVVNEYGPIENMTQQAAETLLGKLRRAQKNAQAKESAGAVSPEAEGVEPTATGSPTPADTSSAGETPQSGADGSSGAEANGVASDAPAELFQAPKGPRGSKRKAAA